MLLTLVAAAGGRDDRAFASTQHMIESGPAGLSLVGDIAVSGAPRLPLTSVTLLAPLPRPVQIRDFSVFPTHSRQAPIGMQKLRRASRAVPSRTSHPDRGAAGLP